MRSITSLLAGWMLAAGVLASSASAAELLMFEEEWCIWCEHWDDQIGVVYSKTEEGQRAPLRRIDIHGPLPTDVTLTSRPQFTPTFILIEDGRELGRIEGYPGEDFFWGLLARLIEKLPDENISGSAATN